jgi:hypothetical protein
VAPPLFGSKEATEDDRELTPEEEKAWEAGLERVVEEKRDALRDPGPTWKEWFFYDHAKWWVCLAFLVIDSWIGTGWVYNGSLTLVGGLETVAALVAAVYLEFLLYRYLWRRPRDISRARFRPSWKALTEYGRWTPEATALRKSGGRPVPVDGGPNPQEFL